MKKLIAIMALLLLPLTVAAPAYGDSTGGSGGSKTNQMNKKFTSGGVTSQYHLYAAGLDWSKPVGLMVYLDGTGEFGLENPNSDYLLSGKDGLINVAKRNNMVLLTPFSPHDCECWHEGDRDSHTQWLESLVKRIQGQYPIETERVALGGYSSGASFMSGKWIPSGAADRTMNKGVAVMISYGGPPWGGRPNISNDLKSNIHMYWNVGDKDDTGGLESSIRGQRWYADNGFRTKIDIIPGLPHNRRDYGRLMEQQIQAHIPVIHHARGGPGFYLINSFQTHTAKKFMYGRDNDEVFIGDWNGDGVDTIAMRRGSTFYVNNKLTGGEAERVFNYGRKGDVILVGDWNNDGTDTFAVRRDKNYHIKNSMSGGDADKVIAYGKPADEVLVGNWNGKGGDTLTVRRGKFYHVKNSMTGGDADQIIAYGREDDEVLVGDWNGNGVDTFGVRREVSYYLKNSISGGDADMVLHYGRPTDTALSGDWNGDGRDTLGLRRTA